MKSPFRPDLLKGQVVLVTGGGTGLGLAMAHAYAAHGADVVIASRKEEHLRPAAKELEAHGHRVLWRTVDVRKPEDVEALMETIRADLGGLDVLVNNAAGNFIVHAEDLTPNGWRAVLGIVLDGTFYCSRAAYPLLSERKGSILNIVATYAWTAAPGTMHSGAAKAGVLNMTGSLAVEWATKGIRVNAIAPGPIETEGAGGQLWPLPGMKEKIESMVPMKRFGTHADVANAALYLASAPYVTGTCLVVDGGLAMGTAKFLEYDGE